MSTDSKETTEESVQEINPFSLDFRADAGFLDFSPKAVSADPKDVAVARLEGHIFGETGIPLEPEQDILPLMEPEPVSIPIEVIPVMTVPKPIIPEKKPSISRNAQ